MPNLPLELVTDILARLPVKSLLRFRKFREVPTSPVEYPVDLEVGSAYETYGFAYDSENDDYIVVRVVEFRGFDLTWIRSETKVYTSKSNAWRKIENFPYQLPYKRVWGVHLNGALHTVVKNVAGHGNFFWSIMAFDVRNEQHYPVPKPDFRGMDVEFTVEVLRDRLCLIRPWKKNRTDIWIMKEYGVKESWTKLLSISPPVVESYVTLCPLAYSKNVCTESLVHPDGLVGEADEDELSQQEKGMGRKLKEKRDDFLSEGFKLVL